MNKKITKTILLLTLIILLLGITSANEVTKDGISNDDTGSKIEQSLSRDKTGTIEKYDAEKNIKKDDNNNIYVSSSGKGDGKTDKTPTNISYALSIAENKDIINLITSTDEDTYSENILINEETVKEGTNTITINGQANKKITINSTIETSNMTLSIKNINFEGLTGVASIESYNSTLNITNCTFKHQTERELSISANTIDELRAVFDTINREADNCKGAIYNTGDNLIISDCTFTDNYLEVPVITGISVININHELVLHGAAIYNSGNNAMILNSKFENNHVIESPLFNPSNYYWERNYIEGGAIYNTGDNIQIKNNTFAENSAGRYGGAIYTTGKDALITNNTFNNNTARYGGAIYNLGENTTISNSRFIKNNGYGAAIYSDNCKNVNISYNIFTQNMADDNSGDVIGTSSSNVTISNNIGDKESIYNKTIAFYEVEATVTYNNFTDILSTKIIVSGINGIIGEEITLSARIIDEYDAKISGGNLAFKLNGKTLRSDGRFDSNASTMKFSVKNGTVTYTIKADLYLRNAKNLTASYSGTSTYNESTSPSVTAQIQKRYASLNVTATPGKAKQYETLTFIIKAADITKNGKNNTLISDNTKVMLKVNGVTLKDDKGKPVYVTMDKNAQATYKYTIPAGTGGITASKAQRNYKVDAIFVGDNYYPGARNTTSFQVERSNTTVTITQAKVTNSNVLSVKATLKDYKGNNLIGTNKVTIKINGKSYTKNGKPVYWSVKNGNIDLTGIQVDPKTTIKRVMIVTGERQAYTEGRSETTNILRT